MVLAGVAQLDTLVPRHFIFLNIASGGVWDIKLGLMFMYQWTVLYSLYFSSLWSLLSIIIIIIIIIVSQIATVTHFRLVSYFSPSLVILSKVCLTDTCAPNSFVYVTHQRLPSIYTSIWMLSSGFSPVWDLSCETNWAFHVVL